jgi:hypothetical protein
MTEPGGTCSDISSGNPYQYSCQMAIYYEELFNGTIFILVFNSIIYMFYYVAFIKYIKENDTYFTDLA